jgi:ferredoxin
MYRAPPPSFVKMGYVSCPRRTALPRRIPQQSTRNTHARDGANENGHTQDVQVLVHFKSANVSVLSKPGQNIYELASENGIDTITLGCCSGNCGICEVEVLKLNGESNSDAAIPIVVRSCITPIPPGYKVIEINELVDDVWGLDGYDT